MSKFPNVEVLALAFYKELVKRFGLSGGTFKDFKDDLSLWAFPQCCLTQSGMRKINMTILGFAPLSIYCVHINNSLYYIVMNPTSKFFFDIEHRFMATYEEALTRYFDTNEVREEK